jgi:hypothetical protein
MALLAQIRLHVPATAAGCESFASEDLDPRTKT